MRFRRADASDTWINDRYAAVQFLPSDLTRDLVLIAYEGDDAAGVGRLVPIDAQSCELGGMLVFEAFRGRGVAKALIDELLRHAEGREVYCLPFAELESLYASAGFARTDAAPAEVLEKWEWCRRTYPNDVLLMRHQR
jgi:GNAT superfamily N-acetyltransferase